jgi:Fe-S cluster biosynthesis and repair protein YggX
LTGKPVLGGLIFLVLKKAFPSEVRVPVDTIQCRRCKKEAPKLEKAPFRNPLGERILEEICQACWSDWLEHQTLLINHYGLDPRDPKARAFLYTQIEKVLLNEEEGEGVDTSRKGSIEF